MPGSRSSRTPLMAMLRRCFRESAHPRWTAPVSPHPWALHRRDFVKGALILGAGALVPGCGRKASGDKSPAGTGTPPKVAIVGAGIAGLSAAHHLAKAGIRAEVFEASGRAGGRIITLKDVMGPGLYTEAGGEFIDTGHQDMLDLAAELGLTVSDMRGSAYQGFKPNAWRFGGSHRSEAEVLAEVKAVAGRLQADIDALPDEIVMGTGGLAAELDRMSLEEYLADRGVTGWFGKLLETAYISEFGLEAAEQSSLNLLTMVSLDSAGPEFAVYGESDERFRVEGGNQAVTDALARKYEDLVKPGHRLEALAGGTGTGAGGTSGYTLSFQSPGGAVERKADTVVLALPFTLLRKVDIRVELPGGKRRAIAELGMGMNSKLFQGYSSRPWKDQGYLGYYYSDGALQSGWDHTQTQAGGAGGLTIFQGGKAGLALGEGAPSIHAEAFAAELEALFPGTRAARTDRVASWHWPTFPWSEGSYACYKPGQWTAFGGEEGSSVGNLHFAGEQCSADFQGYMNGGAETGRQAAETILAKWKGVVKPGT